VRKPREQLAGICGKVTLNGQAKMPELGSFRTSSENRISGTKPAAWKEAYFAESK
jgi:hypothetical protein